MTSDEAELEYDRLSVALFKSPLALAITGERAAGPECMRADEWFIFGLAVGRMEAAWHLMSAEARAARPLFEGETLHQTLGAAAALAANGRMPAPGLSSLLPREPRGEG